MHRLLPFVLALASGVLAACGAGDDRGAGRWAGTIDTLASGQIVVTNPATPSWAPGAEWRVEEEFRIGRLDGEGPDLFGDITSLAVDRGGRIWVIEGQAQELRVFSPIGEHIRTVGRRGGGPGEFARALRIDLAPDGNLWVMDPQNNRLSIFDSTGTYLEGKSVPGGFMIMPWPGGFDTAGRYYAPSPRFTPSFDVVTVRYDAAMAPIDSLESRLTDPIERDAFEIREGGRTRVSAGVPFQGGLVSRRSSAGTEWALLTDRYLLFEVGENGDTLRSITRAFTPLPVTAADRDQAREDLKWFTDQGGKADWSKIPSTKPPVRSFFFDEEGNVWVAIEPATGKAGRAFDIFDAEGRYRGMVELPFVLGRREAPVFRQGLLYAITQDELEVPYLVVARVVKP